MSNTTTTTTTTNKQITAREHYNIRAVSLKKPTYEKVLACKRPGETMNDVIAKAMNMVAQSLLAEKHKMEEMVIAK